MCEDGMWRMCVSVQCPLVSVDYVYDVDLGVLRPSAGFVVLSPNLNIVVLTLLRSVCVAWKILRWLGGHSIVRVGGLGCLFSC